MNCIECEAQISAYLEEALAPAEATIFEMHLQTCSSCAELLEGTRAVLTWADAFPVYEPPPWLAARIVANTPRTARETWRDAVVGVWRWLIEPRTAMGLLTTVLMIGWLGSAAGLSGIGDIVSIAENPAAVCYSAYDSAVRAFYRAPLVTEIQSEIERLREIS